MLRKLNYNAARGRKKKNSNGAVRRIVPDGGKGREGTDKTMQGKATSRRKSKAQEVQALQLSFLLFLVRAPVIV